MIDWSCVGQVRVVVRLSQVPQDGRAQIAFAGASNVGKSTLLGALMRKKKLVRTSKRPGCTRQLYFYEIDRVFWLCDLPGYGYAEVPLSERRRWQQLIEGYLCRYRPHIVLLLDARHAPKATDLALIDWLNAKRLCWMPVATKIDKLSQKERTRRLAEMERTLGGRPICVSARTSEGMDALRYALSSFVCE